MTTTDQPTPAGAPDPGGPAPESIVARPYPAHTADKGSMFSQVLRTTDPKMIGRMYMVTSLAFFAIGGVMALLMRIELARPGMQLLSKEQYNQLFTMHGTIMLLLFATPILFAFANLVVPLQILETRGQIVAHLAAPRQKVFLFDRLQNCETHGRRQRIGYMRRIETEAASMTSLFDFIGGDHARKRYSAA